MRRLCSRLLNESMAARTRVKICGITREKDAEAAVTAGADAIGLVFYAKSPRFVDLEKARRICESLPAFVTSVALFLDPDADQVEAVLDQVPVDLLQFHGSESAAFCDAFNRPWIKAIGIEGEQDLEQRCQDYGLARGILLDSHVMGAAGGTGQTFNWDRIPASLKNRIILAGGLKPDNIAAAIQAVRPYAVDLSSGVESSPGIKDAGLIAQLMQEVQRVDKQIG